MTCKLTRSENMSRIRGSNTKPEILLRKALWEKGFRFRINVDLPGRPDLVFPKSRLAVFVDGCFWHGCPLHYSAPATRQEFWQKKLRDNVLREASVMQDSVSRYAEKKGLYVLTQNGEGGVMLVNRQNFRAKEF